MDDDGVRAEQARLLHEVIDRAGTAVKQLRFGYVSLGGGGEVEACLHHCRDLPAFQRALTVRQRDRLAHTATELIE